MEPTPSTSTAAGTSTKAGALGIGSQPNGDGGVGVAVPASTSGGSGSVPLQQHEERVNLTRATVKQCLQLFRATCRVKLQRCEVPTTPAAEDNAEVPTAPVAENNASTEAPPSEGPTSTNSRIVTKIEDENERGSRRSYSDDDEVQVLPTPSKKRSATKKKGGRRDSNRKSPAVCTICKKTFSSKACLNIHKRQHRGEKRYSCNHCGRSFWSPSTFSMHKKARGQRNGVCPRVNNLRGEWRPKGCWTCKICGKRMKSGNYVPHMQRHRGDKRFKCGVCGSAHVARSHLKIHERIHSDVWQYTCVFCDRGFHQKGNYFDHLRGHTEEKPFFCVVEECGASFRKAECLKRHRQLIH